MKKRLVYIIYTPIFSFIKSQYFSTRQQLLIYLLPRAILTGIWAQAIQIVIFEQLSLLCFILHHSQYILNSQYRK